MNISCFQVCNFALFFFLQIQPKNLPYNVQCTCFEIDMVMCLTSYVRVIKTIKPNVHICDQHTVLLEIFNVMDSKIGVCN